jgi:hypothetical protein
MEATHDDEVSSDPALTRFVTATAAEIAYAEQLLRQIEQRYLNQPAKSRTADKAAAD